MTSLLILGTSTFAVEVADVVSETPGFEVSAFVENLDRTRTAGFLEELPVVWIDDIATYCGSHMALCGLGTTRRSAFIEQAVSVGMSFATVVHPNARVSRRSSVGEGSVVSVAVVVAAHTRIGRHVIINRGSLIGHHADIGDFTSVMSGSNIGGNCRIGEGVYIGMGSVILNNLTIGANSVVGAGAVVTRDVPPSVMVVGAPATIVKHDIKGK